MNRFPKLKNKLRILFSLNFWKWLFPYTKKHALIRLSYAFFQIHKKPIRVDIDGISILLAAFTPYHHHIAKKMHLQEHEMTLLTAWKKESERKTDGAICDIGGYNGIFGIVSALSNPEATVVIFEPDEINYRHIEENVRLNNIKNIRLSKLAISDKKETLHFRSHEGGTGGNISKKDEATTEVDCTSLDLWSEASGLTPTLVKWDIEGAEYKGLVGMKHLLASRNDIRMLLEVHQKFLHRLDASEEKIWSLLNELKYASFWLDQNPFTTHYWVYKDPSPLS